MLPVQATDYSFTNEFTVFANLEVVAYSGSDYATSAHFAQGVGNRLSSVKLSLPGRCGGTGGDPPADLKLI